MRLTGALDQYESICLEALGSIKTYSSKKFMRKPLGNRIKNLIVQIMLLHMVLPRKINFTQMERYGTHTEKTYRQAHLEDVDWLGVNLSLMKRFFKEGDRIAIAIDPSYIDKSGKCTPWTGMFWSGCAGAAKWGLEILGIAAIDIDMHDCISLVAEQTPNSKTLERSKFNMQEWYAMMLDKYRSRLLKVSKYVVADAAFSNNTFVDKLLPMGFHLVSRFRDDIRLRYLYDGPEEKRRGPKRKYAGAIDKKNLDLTKMEEIHVEGVEGKLYTLVANVISLERNVRLVIWINPQGKTKIFFSTDTGMSGVDVVEYYRTRFQIEFVFRNCKEFTGLCDSQARNRKKIHFAFNASLCSGNVAKVLLHESGNVISMASLKSLMVNQYMVSRIISRSACGANMRLIRQINEALLDFERNAA